MPSASTSATNRNFVIANDRSLLRLAARRPLTSAASRTRHLQIAFETTGATTAGTLGITESATRRNSHTGRCLTRTGRPSPWR